MWYLMPALTLLSGCLVAYWVATGGAAVLTRALVAAVSVFLVYVILDVI
jgi:hypothetical protein